MKLNELLDGVALAARHVQDVECSGNLLRHPRHDPGCLFVALPGYKTDGHRYIRQALERGAAAVLCQRPRRGPWLVTEDTRAALAIASANWFRHPARGTDPAGGHRDQRKDHHHLSAQGHAGGVPPHKGGG